MEESRTAETRPGVCRIVGHDKIPCLTRRTCLTLSERLAGLAHRIRYVAWHRQPLIDRSRHLVSRVAGGDFGYGKRSDLYGRERRDCERQRTAKQNAASFRLTGNAWRICSRFQNGMSQTARTRRKRPQAARESDDRPARLRSASPRSGPPALFAFMRHSPQLAPGVRLAKSVLRRRLARLSNCASDVRRRRISAPGTADRQKRRAAPP
ncbi:hypothetical protein DEV91_1553 [Phyllobacterium brassicacearum]|nr:hypothetical protein DEV91_1553 [Phyllobacterium brassicacearum]